MQSHGGRITARSAANPATAVQAVAAFAAWLALEVPALGMNPALDDPPWDAYRERSRRDSEASLNTLREEAAAAGLSSPLRPAKGKSGLPAAPDDPEWWKSEEARRLVDSTLSFQVPTGGWSKGLDFDRVPRRPLAFRVQLRNGLLGSGALCVCRRAGTVRLNPSSLRGKFRAFAGASSLRYFVRSFRQLLVLRSPFRDQPRVLGGLHRFTCALHHAPGFRFTRIQLASVVE